MLLRYGLLVLGVFACSTAVILIRASQTPPILLSAIRLIEATVLLAPLFVRDWKRHGAAFGPLPWKRILPPAIALAGHFITWAAGARMTAAAQASLIVNLAPIAMPFFLHFLLGEKLNRAEILGTLLALLGVALLSVRDALAADGTARGNAVLFASMLLFAFYLTLGRKNRHFPTLWMYVVPVYAVAALICLAVALALRLPWPTEGREWLLLLALAVVPTILGHSLLNASIRHLRGQVVSLFNAGQFLFAGVMAYLLFRELPSKTFYLASALTVAGMAIVVLKSPPQPRLR